VCTSLCSNNGDIMPLFMLSVQLSHCRDEPSVWSDPEQSFWVRLRIDREPEGERRQMEEEKCVA